MPDLYDFLDDEARRVRSEPGALGAVLDRAGRRRRTRRVATGGLALAVAGAGIGLAYAAFRPARQAQPGGFPVPGPSFSASPGPRLVSVVNSSAIEGAADFAAAVMAAEGVGVDVVEVAPSGNPSDVTRIHRHPAHEEEAIRLRDRFFSGAELRPRIDPEVIEIRVGRDFIESRPVLFEQFAAVRSFMTRRLEGSGAEAFLSDDATRQYGSGQGGLALYEGVAEAPFFAIREIASGEDETAVAIVTTGNRTERLTVGDHDPEDVRPEILAAELLSPRQRFEEVRAFVRGFLEARQEASGAGTYLGEDAREAYASHQDGLDLLRYAADEDLMGARIIRYTRLGPNRYEVLARFTLGRPVEPLRVYELLTIEPLGEDGLVVADAERVRFD
ncbi:MAG: LytR C-terminal domain-containing protein [Actinomycetota bacterium]